MRSCAHCVNKRFQKLCNHKKCQSILNLEKSHSLKSTALPLSLFLFPSSDFEIVQFTMSRLAWSVMYSLHLHVLYFFRIFHKRIKWFSFPCARFAWLRSPENLRRYGPFFYPSWQFLSFSAISPYVLTKLDQPVMMCKKFWVRLLSALSFSTHHLSTIPSIIKRYHISSIMDLPILTGNFCFSSKSSFPSLYSTFVTSRINSIRNASLFKHSKHLVRGCKTLLLLI